MNKNEIKPCPFCGNENVFIDTIEDGKDTMYYAFCPECGFESGLYSTSKIIKDKWNRRDNQTNL